MKIFFLIPLNLWELSPGNLQIANVQTFFQENLCKLSLCHFIQCLSSISLVWQNLWSGQVQLRRWESLTLLPAPSLKWWLLPVTFTHPLPTPASYCRSSIPGKHSLELSHNHHSRAVSGWSSLKKSRALQLRCSGTEFLHRRMWNFYQNKKCYNPL